VDQLGPQAIAGHLAAGRVLVACDLGVGGVASDLPLQQRGYFRRRRWVRVSTGLEQVALGPQLGALVDPP
jgi:hypothetical protein